MIVGSTSGLLLAIGSLPLQIGTIGLGLLSFGALVPALRAIDRGVGLGHAWLIGWTCGIAFVGLGFAWVPFVQGGGPAVWFGYAFGIGLLSASLGTLTLCLALLRRLGRGVALAAAPALWIALEVLWSQGELGISWLLLGYAIADSPFLLRPAAFGGALALSFWIVAVNAAAAATWRPLGARAATAAVLLVTPPAVGLLTDTAPVSAPPDSLSVGAVQPNRSATTESFEARFQAALPGLLRLSESAVREGADLVIWPETAFERPLGPWHDPWLGLIAGQLGVPLLTGARRLSPGEPPALHNSAVLVGPDGRLRSAADKVRPVPFYERAPGSPLAHALARRGLWSGRIEPGGAPGLVEVAVAGGAPATVGVLVCMDSSFPGLGLELRRRGARLIVALADARSIGAWPARQHARMSRVRAVELRAPVAHVSNTGPTQWFDDRGRRVRSLPAGSAAAGAARVALAGAPPPYVLVGDRGTLALAWLPALALLLGSAARRAGARRPTHAVRAPATEIPQVP